MMENFLIYHKTLEKKSLKYKDIVFHEPRSKNMYSKNKVTIVGTHHLIIN